jgi:predicted AlkP superfamily pyrophosphatase or phosphodiesterase
VAQGGCTFIYCLDQTQQEATLEKVAGLFKDVEGIDLVIEPKDFERHGLVSPAKDPRMADLVLTAKEGYTFSDVAVGDLAVTPASEQLKGSHGHSPSQPLMYGTFVAWGQGIKSGAAVREVRNTDVAPTIARLLGLRMSGTDGKAIDQILAR